MKILTRPVPKTVLFGAVCGLSFIPLKLALDYWFFQPNTISLTLWLYAAGYTLLLCFWSRQNLTSALYPVLFMLLTASLVHSASSFFCLALAGVSWIRSGICYSSRRGRWVRLMAEITLAVMGGTIVVLFNPASTPAWAMAIWLFFLLQALYFTIYDSAMSSSQSQREHEIDPFELASRRAEDILAKGDWTT